MTVLVSDAAFTPSGPPIDPGPAPMDSTNPVHAKSYEQGFNDAIDAALVVLDAYDVKLRSANNLDLGDLRAMQRGIRALS